MKRSTAVRVCAVLGIVVLVTAAVYALVPPVRYFLIPLIGNVKAPSLPCASLGRDGEDAGLLFVPGTLSNAERTVSRIEEVPSDGGWINTAPLDVEALYARKRCVLFDFWSYSSIGCVRSVSHTQRLWERYRDYGLVVIGVHSPEFAVERPPRNVNAAVARLGITYPVLTDGARALWDRFGNRALPGKYLVSPRGEVVYSRFGEGDYAETERRVREALTAAGWRLPDYGPPGGTAGPTRRGATPVLYAGAVTSRRPCGNREQPVSGRTTEFRLPARFLEPDRIYLSGPWTGRDDHVAASGPGVILLNYEACAVYVMLARAAVPLEVEVTLDGRPVPREFRGQDLRLRRGRTVLRVDRARLYVPVAPDAPFGRHTIALRAPAGLRFYSFSFGMY